MIFQDPFSSLNPRMLVRDIIGEPLDLHTSLSKEEKKEKIDWLLEKVGLSKEQSNRYPHEFSGGQRQRIGIARALATEPEIIIADEPVSALDVSIQGQVVNLLKSLQKKYKLTYIFITHDLSIAKHISDNIMVLYFGQIVEMGKKDKIFIADEPVSALDVSIQAQVINLMMDLQEEFNLTIIFIAHDLSVVKHISSHVAVMYLGEIVEYNEVDEIFNNPQHEYTKTLLTAIPQPNPKGREKRKKERLDSKKYNM